MHGYEDVSNSLVWAVRQGRLERVRQLINTYGLSYSQAWSDGYVLLCDALQNNETAVAKLLLTSGSKVNKKNNKKLTTSPLHFAVCNRDIEIVGMILDRGGYVNAKDNWGSTPLQCALKTKKVEIIELLLKSGADVNASDNHGASLIHAAVEVGHLQIVEHFLKNGAYVNAIDELSRSPLHAAVGLGHLQVVDHLLKNGADVHCVYTSTWRKGCAPLHLAVEIGNKEITMLLLSYDANVDVKKEDGITPLHIAAKKGYIRIAEDLLNHGASIHSLTLKEGLTPLHFASEQGSDEAVNLFLYRGAEIDTSTKDNLTPLYIATREGHEAVVRLLLQRGAKVDDQDKDGKTILQLAVDKGNFAIVEDVLKYSPDINNQGNRSSIKAAVHGNGKAYQNIIEALLEYGLIVNPEDANDPQLLHAAVEKGYLKTVEDLLKFGADVNTLYKSLQYSWHHFTEGFTPLHSAAKNCQVKVAELLIKYEADINAQDKKEKTPIYYAINNSDFRITKLLLTNGANAKDNPELLNIAVKKRSKEIVEALLQHDVDINASDKDGRTALHFTALKDDLFGFRTYEDADVHINGEIAKLLLSKGANVDARTKCCETTLHAAIQNECVEVVEALLEYNANVNSEIKGVIPLHLSAQNANGEITKLLLNKGANVNAKQYRGITALHIAAENGNEEITKVLLNKGANVNAKQYSGMTALHIAAENGHGSVVKVLLEYGAKADSNTTNGIIPLHIASQEGHVKIVELLLEYGSDIKITSKKKHTALDCAIAGSDDDLFDYDHGYYPFEETVEETVETLKRHIVKMKTANLYVSKRNLSRVSSYDERSGFQDECKEEIASMKIEKINNANISYNDILTKDTSLLARYLRNEDIVQVLKADDCKTKFPIYASMIRNHFRKGMEKKEFLEQGHQIFHFLFKNLPELPYHCIEKIFSYLKDEDLRILMDACKPPFCHQ